MNCARPSCVNVRIFEHSELCGECVLAEERAMFAVDFDHLARMDDHYPEHRTRHDRREKPKITPYLVKADADPFGTRYGQKALQNILQRMHEREDRNNSLFVAACQVGSLIAGGCLDGASAMASMTEAAENYCPDEKLKARGTIARGVRTGMREPRRAA
jgi:hypothetical protein